MKNVIRSFDILSIGGKHLTEVAVDIKDRETIAAPLWLLREFDEDYCSETWFLTLLPNTFKFSSKVNSTLLLWRKASAAASDPRVSRLLAEKEKIEELNNESDYVRIIPLHKNQAIPEAYKAIFFCRGIIGIHANQNPIYGDEHEVEITCNYNFPTEPPTLKWLTKIWHPNIHHNTKEVCINRKEWVGGMTIIDLCRQLFEMVQYKNYHAIFVDPNPLDGEVAKWVTDYAEPRNIVNKRKGVFIDNKPFTKPDSRIAQRLLSASSEKRITILNNMPSKEGLRIKLIENTQSPNDNNSEIKINILNP